MTTSISEHLSEQWLIERTYHAYLRNGKELSVSSLTEAMKQLIAFPTPLSTQSSKSRMAQRLPLKKSINFSVPISTWEEILQGEASALYRQGMPVLLYGEHVWHHPIGTAEAWRPNSNMRTIISGNDQQSPEPASGTEYAVCYLDPKGGAFSNDAWNSWFASETDALLHDWSSTRVTFLGPSVLFPYNTHYTVIASDGHTSEYADRAGAIQGFQALPPQEGWDGNGARTVFPQFCYYHEVACPGGVYRLEFFGPRMDERGYQVKEAKDQSKGTV